MSKNKHMDTWYPPSNNSFIKKVWNTGQGGGVGFFCRKTFSPSIVTSPDFRSFKSIIQSFKSNYNFIAACLYHPPGSCTTGFLEDFLVLSGFLSSIVSNLIIYGDINVHQDVGCCDRSRFNNFQLHI